MEATASCRPFSANHHVTFAGRVVITVLGAFLAPARAATKHCLQLFLQVWYFATCAKLKRPLWRLVRLSCVDLALFPLSPNSYRLHFPSAALVGFIFFCPSALKIEAFYLE